MTMRDIMMVEIYGVNFAIIDVVKEMEGYTAWVSFCTLVNDVTPTFQK